MGYPARLLSDDEVIESEFRPHWTGIIREGFIVVAGIALTVVLLVFANLDYWVYVALWVLAGLLIVRGLVRWATTLHVITNERLIYRAGLIAKQGTELPLEVIQNVAFNQTIFERIFGTGDLMIESAGTHGQTRYRDIPDPEAVQLLIYTMREFRMQAIESGTSTTQRVAAQGESESTDQTSSATGTRGQSKAAQLEILSRLHDEGKLSDDEFEGEKQKLLGGDG